MSIWGSIALGLGLAFALGWIGRWTAQKMSKSAPRFRDMALVVAFGYVLALELLLGGIWPYFLAPVSDAGVPRASVMFWRWAVHFVVFCAVASVIFRLIGRQIPPRHDIGKGKDLFLAMRGNQTCENRQNGIDQNGQNPKSSS